MADNPIKKLQQMLENKAGGGDRFGRGGPPPIPDSSDDRSRSSPLGTPRGYVAERAPLGPWERFSAIRGGSVVPQPSRYFDGDQYLPASRMTPAMIFEMQQTLAQLGLLTGSFQAQVWDEATAKAYAKVLGYANQQGLSETQALRQLATMGGPDGGGRYSVNPDGSLSLIEGDGTQQDIPPLITRTTDPKVVEQIFRRGIIEQLGQGVSKEELLNMVAAYNQMEEQRQTDMYNLQVGQDGVPSAGSVVDVPSPENYLDAELAENYGEEMQDYQGMQMMGDAMGFLSSPAWGANV